MEYEYFRKNKLDKYFTKRGLYLIGPNVVKTKRAVTRSGSSTAMNLVDESKIYK